jgi:hypothetical protein
MLKHALLVVVAVLCFATAPAAQDRGERADPISGKWGSDSQALLELQYDGKGAVTGMTIWRADGKEITRAPIEKGTFNPKTGVFKLEGEARRPPENTVTRFVIEGKVEKDTATGTYQLGGEKGEFTFQRLP